MRRRAHRQAGEAGFTLIELVVALALVGLVSALSVQGIRLAALGLDRVSRQTERLDERRSLETVLRHSLGGAALLAADDGDPAFAGTATRLTFLSLADDAGIGLYRIDLAFDAARADRPLLVTRRLARPYGEPRMQQAVLARQGGDFAIAYFGATAPGEPAQWQPRWEGIGYLPRLVRVTLGAGDGLVRPPIVVRLWNAD